MHRETANGKRDVTVRRATAGDAAALADVGERTFVETFAAVNTAEDMSAYLASAFGPEIQAAEIAEEGALFLVAEANGEVAGYAKLLSGGERPDGVSGDRPVEIVRLYALAAWHGAGVGAALMGACIAEAAARGHDTVWLGVWEENHRAIAFYSKWGFRRVGAKPFLLGADLQTDLVLERPLNGAESGSDRVDPER